MLKNAAVRTLQAPEDELQNVIWAFGSTPPQSADADAPFSIHQRMGRGTLNLTRVAPSPSPSPEPSPEPSPTPPLHEPQPEPEEDEVDGGRGGSASFVHGALCIAGFLLVLPAGAIVARYAKVTGNARAFQLHRLLQFVLGSCCLCPLHLITTQAGGVISAGASIAGGMLAYLFMDSHHSSTTHKVRSPRLFRTY